MFEQPLQQQRTAGVANADGGADTDVQDRGDEQDESEARGRRRLSGGVFLEC